MDPVSAALLQNLQRIFVATLFNSAVVHPGQEQDDHVDSEWSAVMICDDDKWYNVTQRPAINLFIN